MYLYRCRSSNTQRVIITNLSLNLRPEATVDDLLQDYFQVSYYCQSIGLIPVSIVYFGTGNIVKTICLTFTGEGTGVQVPMWW